MKLVSDKNQIEAYQLIQHAQCHGKISRKHICSTIAVVDSIRTDLKKSKATIETVLYTLMGLGSVNIHLYDEDEEPEFVTIGHYVIASECSEEFNLTPGKSYLVEGVGYDLICVTNEIGKPESYSVENFTQRDKSKNWQLKDDVNENNTDN